MVRATHGVHRGSYYYEVEILPHTPTLTTEYSVQSSSSGDPPQEALPSPHIRIGWSTRQGELQAPVGFDQNSFGYRDESGECSHHLFLPTSTQTLLPYHCELCIIMYVNV